MTRRLTFLIGHLTGIALGAILMFTYFTNQPQRMQRSTIDVPLNRVVVPENVPPPLPKGWHRHEFNGRPFYVIPLAESDV